MRSFCRDVVPAGLRGLAVAAIVFSAGGYVYFGWALPAPPAAAPAARQQLEWPRIAAPGPADWAVFRSPEGRVPAQTGPLARRFRLAGTFFAFGDAGSEGSYCKAVLDDVEKKDQYLVKEGDALEDVRVVRILRDRVVLRSGDEEEELWLSFSGVPAGAGQPAPRGAAAGAELPALEENRFGKRVGESRWVFNRDALMTYYQELIDDPERLAAVYVSMKPDYKDGKIAGYLVDIEGEKEFFQAAGLRNGDIVRKVNSMNMTSQKRAEYFIGEFVKNRVNAVVFDIERDKQAKKLIYLIR